MEPDHDAGVRQRITLALGTGSEQERTHAGGHADTDGAHLRLDELHRIVDAETGINATARAVNVKRDVLIGIFAFQEQ